MADADLTAALARLREALRPPACRALENLADVLHRRPPRWADPQLGVPRVEGEISRG